MSEERFSEQYWRGESPGTLRSAVVVRSDKAGVKRRQSNDRTLMESFIVGVCETQSIDCMFETSQQELYVMDCLRI